MNMVRTSEECELAATDLGLSDTTAHSSQTPDRPYGCIYASNDWLNWYEPAGSPYTSVPCGSMQDSNRYDCLCSKKGKN